jgi:hypothetical protein
MAIVIKKRPATDGAFYEVDNYRDYVAELERIGIASPKARYRVFVSATTARDIAARGADLEAQVAQFFRLGPDSGIAYKFHAP